MQFVCVGDNSASVNTHEEEIDQRLKDALSMEDPDILLDLRHLNTNGTSIPMEVTDLIFFGRSVKLFCKSAQLFMRGDMATLLI